MTKLANTATYSRGEIEARLDSEKYAAIPERTRYTLKLYLFHRLRPGSGTRSVLENAPVGEVLCRLDEPNKSGLPALLAFLHNEVPGVVHRSILAVEKWLSGETEMFENWEDE